MCDVVQNNEDTKRLLANSVGFFESAKAIMRIGGPPVHFPALYVNFYYAVELSLKAYLSSRGRTRKQLRAIGHQLVALLAEATSAGLSCRDPRVSTLVGQLDQNLLNLRYLDGTGFEVEEPDITERIVAFLLEDVAHGIPVADLL